MGTSQTNRRSIFFHQTPESQPDSLGILHLRRDLQAAFLLRDHDEKGEGYAEGKVLNTRFGSFPHSTLLGVPWGSQVGASLVDTGSRGRRNEAAEENLKRKRTETPDGTPAGSESKNQKAAVAATSGFGHLLPPTPERWTYSLPHRTQVVYTPDYSYVLQRIRARPGTVLIEAGAGSGSFSHAAARAVFDGKFPSAAETERRGRVWSFEYHAQRAEELSLEIHDHGLDPLITVTHRDVYKDGFTVYDPATPSPEQLVRATAVFLDLPAPWQAIPHLTRSGPNNPLDPTSTVHICTFLPCIEQVQAAVSALRSHGWVDIGMAELAAKRIDVRRERVGLHEEGLKGVTATAASVDEAVSRLRELEERAKLYHTEAEAELGTKQDRLRAIREEVENRNVYKEGRLVHRSEPELKSHTSYLVFAVLPREWSEEDERKAAEAASGLEKAKQGKSKKQMKKEKRAAAAESDAVSEALPVCD